MNTQTTPTPWQSATLSGAEECWLTSNISQKTYRIQVALIGEPRAKGYPSLWLLDGDQFFPFALSFAQSQFIRPEKTHAQALAIIGIGYSKQSIISLKERAQDYTPPPYPSAEYGGAAAFRTFIEEELKPYLSQAFALHPTQHALFGHSFGGLFTLYQLFTAPQQYQHYFATSPSIWWHHRHLLQHEPSQLPLAAPTFLRLSAGEYEQPPPQHAQSERDKLQSRGMIREIQALEKRLAPANPLLNLETHIYPKHHHGSAPFPALIDAINLLSQAR